MFNQKGQEAAVFELLIAIIVMGFVIVVGFNALSTLEEKTCQGTLNQNLEELRTAIETVVKNKSKVNVSYRLPNCFPEKETTLRIVERDSAVFCNAVCEGSVKECTVLSFTSPEYSESKCLRISSATNFPDASTCNKEILEGNYDVVQWKQKQGIVPGDYTLIRQSGLVSKSPVVCVYRRS